MAFRESYRKRVELLLRTLPHVAEEKDFALKGGTAINLFVRNFPRLSVDVDLTFLPVLPRSDQCGCVPMRSQPQIAVRNLPDLGPNTHDKVSSIAASRCALAGAHRHGNASASQSENLPHRAH